MYQRKVYNLFISHSWTYSDAYARFCTLLDKATGFSYKNYSVPKDDPIHNAPTATALYLAIKRQMAPCNVVIIMAGVYATYSAWIDREIQIATSEFTDPKPIIGVRPWGNERISSIVSENANEIVGWNTDSIVSAIKRHSI